MKQFNSTFQAFLTITSNDFCLICFFTSQSTLFQLCKDILSFLARINMSRSWTQHSDVGEALTRNSSVSDQALFYWATALPLCADLKRKKKHLSMTLSATLKNIKTQKIEIHNIT